MASPAAPPEPIRSEEVTEVVLKTSVGWWRRTPEAAAAACARPRQPSWHGIYPFHLGDLDAGAPVKGIRVERCHFMAFMISVALTEVARTVAVRPGPRASIRGRRGRWTLARAVG
jgi:hypothetical protein